MGEPQAYAYQGTCNDFDDDDYDEEANDGVNSTDNDADVDDKKGELRELQVALLRCQPYEWI